MGNRVEQRGTNQDFFPGRFVAGRAVLPLSSERHAQVPEEPSLDSPSPPPDLRAFASETPSNSPSSRAKRIRVGFVSGFC